MEAICNLLRIGNYLEPSVIANGVPKSTFYKWLKRGGLERKRLRKNKRARIKKREARYVALVDAVEKAQAMAEARGLMAEKVQLV